MNADTKGRPTQQPEPINVSKEIHERWPIDADDQPYEPAYPDCVAHPLPRRL